MRLIDADAFYETAKNIWDHADSEDFEKEIFIAIATAPTIEERKKGKWERAYLDHKAMGERPSIFYCSVCNQCISYPVNYCPNCGADMRGEQE